MASEKAPIKGQQSSFLLRALKFTVLACSVVIVLAGGYTLIPWYYYHYHVRNQLAVILRNGAVETDEELKRKMVQVAKKSAIEAEARDFAITRTASAITAKLHYTEECRVSILGRNVLLFSKGFDISVEGDLS